MTCLLGQIRIFKVDAAFRIKGLVGVYLTGGTNEMTSFHWLMMKRYELSIVGIIN